MNKALECPKDLVPRGRGRRFWRKVTATYGFRPDELVLLEEVCRHMDLVDEYRSKIAEGQLVIAGSRGQPAPHPLLQELRSSRDLIGKLLRQLGFEDEPDARAGNSRSAAGRALAQQRWRMGAPVR